MNPHQLHDQILPHVLREARQIAKGAHTPVDTFLCEKMRIDADTLLLALGAYYQYPTQRLLPGEEQYADFDTVSLAECRRRGLFLTRQSDAMQVYFSDPCDQTLQVWAQALFKEALRWVLVLDSDLTQCLDRLEGQTLALTGALTQGNGQEPARRSTIEEISLARLDETTSPVVRLVNSTIYDALGVGASDIHLESMVSGLVVKYRIDGVLSEAARTSGIDFTEKVLSRIKVMAELDITERRIPQDGRFKVRVRDRDIDFRVSVMPSVFGEDAVIRILDKVNLSHQLSGLTLDHLGFNASAMHIIRGLATNPYGMLLVTGPTGSGKTTTLYAALSEINDGRDKIITIEDPVEYQLPGVLQIPVNERKGLSFEVGLRSILRHDPDKIMVGEIRDGETAQIAVQAALTGHLVFSTIHANNVFDVLGRFEHMHVDPYSLVSALNGIVAQRLVRMVCPHCAEPVPMQAGEQLQNVRYGPGCRECRNTGYKGRKAIAECLVLDDELRELIATRSPIRSVKEAAKARGTRLLRESAEELVRQGLTTVEEINRVTFAR